MLRVAYNVLGERIKCRVCEYLLPVQVSPLNGDAQVQSNSSLEVSWHTPPFLQGAGEQGLAI